MLHNRLIAEYPCDGELIREEEGCYPLAHSVCWLSLRGVLRSSLAVHFAFMQTCVSLESFATQGSGLCQRRSYLCSHSRQQLMRPIEIPENRAG
jgi:hypothetical protein